MPFFSLRPSVHLLKYPPSCREISSSRISCHPRRTFEGQQARSGKLKADQLTVSPDISQIDASRLPHDVGLLDGIWYSRSKLVSLRWRPFARDIYYAHGCSENLITATTFEKARLRMASCEDTVQGSVLVGIIQTMCHIIPSYSSPGSCSPTNSTSPDRGLALNFGKSCLERLICTRTCTRK